MAKIYTGLDIGSKTIKLVQLKHGRGTAVQLINFATAEIPRINAELHTPNSELVSKTIGNLLAAQKIKPNHLVTAIPKHLTTVRSITLPTDSPSEIEQMIRFEAAKHIPFLSEDDILDFQIMGTSAIGGSQVLLVAVRKPVIDEHLAVLKKIGVEPKIVSVSSVAIYTATKQSDQLEEGAIQVLIDIGASMTDLTLVQNRILVYSRSATVAGNQLIERFQQEFQLDEVSAESLLPLIDLGKPNFGLDTYHQDRVTRVINPWLESLENEIKQSLEYFRSESGVAQIDSIVLSGGLSRLKGLATYLAKELNIELTLANPFKNTDLRFPRRTAPRTDLGSPDMGASFTVAVGLGLRGFETALGAGINLLPQELLKKRKRTVQQRKYIVVGALAGLIFLTGIGAGYREYAIRGKRISEIKLKLNETAPLASKLKEMQSQIERIKGMFSPDDPAIDALSFISQLEFVPKQVAIIRYDYKRNIQLTIDGVAIVLPDVIAFRETLDKSGLFDVVKLRDTRAGQMEGKPVQFFTIECKLKKTKQETVVRKI